MTTYDIDQLCVKFKEAVTASKAGNSKDNNVFTTKACARLCKDAKWPKNVSSYCDTSAYPAIKAKGKQQHIDLNDKALVKGFMEMCGKEAAKTTKGKTAEQCEDDLAQKVIQTEFQAAQKGTSSTGGVDRLTDTSKYTGAHKERFDKDGKGKGAEGRTDKADNSGYVGNYKGQGTYDQKK